MTLVQAIDSIYLVIAGRSIALTSACRLVDGVDRHGDRASPAQIVRTGDLAFGDLARFYNI